MSNQVQRQRVTVELGTPDRWARRNPRFLRARQQPKTSRFRFELCRQQLQLGAIEFDQWWFDKRGLYGDRGTASPEHDRIIDCFWGIVLRHGTAFDDPGIQEAYILSKLLPFARSNGSRRVFLDSTPRERTRIQETEELENLDRMLASAAADECSIRDFHTSTQNAIGPPEYDHEIFDLYEQHEGEIMEAACEIASTSGEQAVELAREQWDLKMTQIGRRVGNETAKTVLDILSYECRAAFHRCYSVVWAELLRELQDSFAMAEESSLFHTIWHVDLARESNETVDSNFHLFHGHIFGLHPGCADFLRTPTGRDLFGTALEHPESESNYRKLFNGLVISIYAYAGRHQIARE